MALDIYTDGGCSGNPGPGSWAYVMVQKTFQGDIIIVEDSGSEKETTNNRMELLAVISALKALKIKTDITRNISIHTDSQYVQKGITEWIKKWKINSWKTADKKPVKNQDLWQELDTLCTEISPGWNWVKGHAGNVYNERCDALVKSLFNTEQ